MYRRELRYWDETFHTVEVDQETTFICFSRNDSHREILLFVIEEFTHECHLTRLAEREDEES